MARIQEDILDAFFERLSELPEIEETMVTELRAVLSRSDAKKIKADELVDVFTQKSEQQVG